MLKGLDPPLEMMEGTFCGDTVRLPRSEHRWPELYIYSKRDLYVSYKFLEDQVIRPHLSSGRDVTSKRFDNSTHVCHLQRNKREYVEAVHQFLHKQHFSLIKHW